MNLLSQADDIWGKISPPADSLGGDPVAGVSNLISFGIQAAFVVAGILLLVYLLWGALDWVTSEGQKEKLQKAQNKIINAVIGMVMVIVAYSLFIVVMGALGNKIIDCSSGQCILNIPHI